MKVRKTKDLQSVLQKRGFVFEPKKGHHKFYFLEIDGIRHPIYTYLSHGTKEYGPQLMAQIKKQLKFETPQKADDFSTVA